METTTQQLINDIRQEFNLDLSEVIQQGIITPQDAKRWLVKQHYYKLYKTNRSYTDIKNELSTKYNISVSSIEKMVYRKN